MGGVALKNTFLNNSQEALFSPQRPQNNVGVAAQNDPENTSPKFPSPILLPIETFLQSMALLCLI